MISYNQILDLGQEIAKLISISDFSKGKTSNIFEDVKTNNSEYVVLKNNQPTGVVVSYEWYNQMKKIFVIFKDTLKSKTEKGVTIGGGKGNFPYPKDFDKWDKEIVKLFVGA